MAQVRYTEFQTLPEYLIDDRLSFMRFLGLGLSDRVPDAKTGWPISSIICAAFSSWSGLTSLRSNPGHETLSLLKTQNENQVQEPAINTPKT